MSSSAEGTTSPVGLAPEDEREHVSSGAPRWQENYFLLGRDDASGTVLYLHLERFAGRGEVEAKAFVEVNGRRASTVVCAQADSCFGLDGIGIELEQPFRRWNVITELTGHTDEPDGWAADRPGGTTPFGFDITLVSLLGPTDWTAAAAALGMPDVVIDHYEVPCRWSGTVRCGDARVRAEGLLVRDHSWGPRDLGQLDYAWWTPMVFEDAYLSGLTLLADGQHRGFMLVDTGSGAKAFEQPWVRLAGFPQPRGYGSADVRWSADGIQELASVRVATHIPVPYPGMGSGHFFNDAMGIATWGDRRGFGLVELNRH